MVKARVGITFVGGVHGVGKSTCCQQASERTGIQWVTASALIKAERESAIAEHSKKVREAAGNQDLLIRALRKRVSSSHERIILDGHFSLLGADGEIILLGIEVFSQLGLEGIVVFRDDPASVSSRLRERDGQDWPISTVERHQDAEVEHGRVVASSLDIRFVTLSAFDADGLVKAVGILEVSSS
jgi:adenylate kinase